MPDCIVELKPRPRDRVTVSLTGGRFFTIPAEQAALLAPGRVLADDEVERLDRIDQYFRGRDKAMRLLALRARTQHEMRTALDALSILPAVRDGLLAELEEMGLVDDTRFARDYVRVKADVRSMGPHRLRQDLKRRGVRRAVVDGALGEELTPERQEATARALVARKLGAGAPDEKTVRRIAGMLRRKGFDYEIVNRIAYELLQRVGRDVDD
jgi:regulatory protein